MRQVVIIGNSGAARECYWLLEQVRQKEDDLAFKGFLSFEGFPHQLHELAQLEMGVDEDYAYSPEDVFVLGLGAPPLRARAYAKWKERGARFINLIHPDVFIPPSSRLGEANVIAWSNFISCNVTLGNVNYLNTNVTLGHDVVLGDANFIGSFSIVQGHARLGSRNRLASQSVILASVEIGDDNILAPGTVMYKGCAHKVILAGNPAFVMDG